MGFFEKARDGIARKVNRASEETVRVIDYDEPEDQDEEIEEEEYDETPNDSAFEITETPKSFFKKKNKPVTPEEEQAELSAKIDDVLELLDIPATFTIDPDVLMPEDLDDIEFDMQVPQGYDLNQVQSFFERTRSTLKVYVKLLRERNAHIAKLATTVDRLKVDLNNMKFENQIANGINIIPTDDNDDLERENFELRLEVKRIKEQIQAIENTDGMSDRERERYDEMRDKVSELERENEELKDTNYNQKTQIASLLEDIEDMEVAPAQQQWDEPDNDEAFAPSQPDSELELPTIGNYTRPDEHTSYTNSNSAFAEDEESFEEFVNNNQEIYMNSEDNNQASYVEILDDNGSTYDNNFGTQGGFTDTDEDDELDKLMNEWNKD